MTRYTSKDIRAAHEIVAVLYADEKRSSARELRERLALVDLDGGERGFRRAVRYARDHGAPVMCTRDGRKSTYWLEFSSTGTRGMPDRYLDDAYKSLMAWYHMVGRSSRDSEIRGLVDLAVRGIGRYQRKDPEQVTVELNEYPVDEVIESILNG